MKRMILTILMIVMGVIEGASQTNQFVNHVEKQGNTVYLYMNTQEFLKLTDESQKLIIKMTANQNDAKSVCVILGYEVELWQMEGDTLSKIDEWDKNVIKTLSNDKKTISQRGRRFPWFFNISGSINYFSGSILSTEPSTLTYNAYGRVGCYLLKGRWDMALNLVIGYNKARGETKGSYSNSFGIDTRVYILKGKAINPFVGVGLAYATGREESSFTVPITAGLSIPVKGKGCIDLCYQYNRVTKSAFIVGYTFMHK